MKESALEGLKRPEAARPFRCHHKRVTGAHLIGNLENLLGTSPRLRRFATHKNGVKKTVGAEFSERTRKPVVLGGQRAGQETQTRRQGSPHQNCIEVRGVVKVVDALSLRQGAQGDREPLADVLAPHIRAALAAIGRADSVTIDPHKLGYVPYSSGAFLAAHQQDYTCVQTLAPYLDYDDGGDRGPYTLEGSRSAAGAVATWLTARSLGLDESGYGLLLARTIRQKRKLEDFLKDKLPSAHVTPGCDTNLLCFCIADPGEAVSSTNQRTLRILQRLMEDALYYLSKTAFPIYPGGWVDLFIADWKGRVDTPHLVVLRLSLMNPFFDSSELDVNHIERLVFALAEVAD